jgi:hypothetical protein
MTHGMKTLVLAAGLVCAAWNAQAAVTEHVKRACRDEYFTYCSAYPVGSRELRKCMRRSQYRFSDRCLRALVAAGEASKRDIMRYRAHKARQRH